VFFSNDAGEGRIVVGEKLKKGGRREAGVGRLERGGGRQERGDGRRELGKRGGIRSWVR